MSATLTTAEVLNERFDGARLSERAATLCEDMTFEGRDGDEVVTYHFADGSELVVRD